jgi:hypothetical protein
MNKRPRRLLVISTAFFVAITSTNADEPARHRSEPDWHFDGGGFTKEEKALLDKNRIMEMYKPDEHSRHFIARIDSAMDPKTGEKRKIPDDARAVLCFVFGIEDAKPARDEGRSMAECHYSSQQAHEFLFAQGWGKYHDRFFTRCYLQEGEAAYDQQAKAQQKPIDPASTG